MASAVVASAAASSSSNRSSSLAAMDEARSNSTSNTNHSNELQIGESNQADVEMSEATTSENAQPRQPQHLGKNESRSNASVETETSNASSRSPLPTDLRRILVEVAKTGACSWMSWDQETEGLASLPLLSPTPVLAAKAPYARQPFFTHRRSQGPPRKKHRNGVHKSRRRYPSAESSAVNRSAASNGRKRPLFLIRTNPSSNANNNYASTPGSVGSGRTSGSEPDDSTHYESDSEGTYATTNSEVSSERLRKTQHLASVNALQSQNIKLGPSSALEETSIGVSQNQYKTLQESFRVALGNVLDHFYKHRGGYKLSPAEKRRYETVDASDVTENMGGENKPQGLSSEVVFQQRRQKLLSMMLPETMPQNRKMEPTQGPPFTIQRIAEVLVSPERYYTQTHKLCNCLEKLLLVKSSTEAFGGSRGGDTSQTRREEQEMAALANEKGRQESELRQRRLRRRMSSPSDDVTGDTSNSDGGARPAWGYGKDEMKDQKKSPREKPNDGQDHRSPRQRSKNDHGSSDEASKEILDAAKASLRSKFDHVGIDPHSPDRDVRAIAESRSMTNSPPPPSLAMSAAPSNIALQGHSGVSGFVRQHLPEQTGDHQHLARVPSPILFSSGDGSGMHATTNMHMLQLHHAVALAGVQLGRSTSLDLMGIPQHNNLVNSTDNTDGRSSTSNSDVDSESDDISFDDSASDRSDGSDSGSYYEPSFTAARAMALNRIQQQQRLQSRVLTSLNLHQSEGFRPPADSEYQSGDSIDSTRAEDSGGSDSSSSDLAD